MELNVINDSNDKAVKNNEDIFSQMICLPEGRRSKVQQQVLSRQEAEVSRLTELQKKLEQKIIELRRRDAWLEMLSHCFSLLAGPTSSHMRWKSHSDTSMTWQELYLSSVIKHRNSWWTHRQDLSRWGSKIDVFTPELSDRENFLLHPCQNTANRQGMWYYPRITQEWPTWRKSRQTLTIQTGLTRP